MFHLLLARNGPVLELTLDRPARRNALSAELIADLHAALRQAAADTTLRAVVLTGTPPAFCAGLDLDDLLCTAPGRPHDASALGELLAFMESGALPIVAAVGGPAMAGGAGLVCSADLAVFGTEATFGYPWVQRGLVAPVIMPGLVRAVGERRARRLLLTGESLTADQALAWGLASEVVPDAEVLPRARALAARLAALPRAAVAETKRWLACALRTGGEPPSNWAMVLRCPPEAEN